MEEPVKKAHLVNQLYDNVKKMKEVRKYLTNSAMKVKLSELIDSIETQINTNEEWSSWIAVPAYPDYRKYRLTDRRTIMREGRRLYHQSHRILTELSREDLEIDFFLDDIWILPGMIAPPDLI